MIWLLSFEAKAQQFHIVGGNLVGENVWGTDDIPYYIESNLYISAFATLKILPGTKVYIDNSISIFINGGRFEVSGTEEDPVEFDAFSSINWKSINIVDNSTIIINNAIFSNAENGIEVKKCDNISITNSIFRDIYYNSISITNSNNCEISDCTFDRIYNSIYFSAYGLNESCSNNTIFNNKFINGNKNIYFSSSNEATCNNNIIKNNIFEGSPVSVHLENSNNFNSGINYVNQNIFYSNNIPFNNPSDNIGIYLSMDSVYIENNIFWKTGTAVYLKRECASFVNKNTFFDNNICFNNIPKIKKFIVNDNLFLENKNSICTFTNNTLTKSFSNNNLLITDNLHPFFYNYSTIDIDLTNNFWNTKNDSIINNVIIDKNDNSIYGRIIFDPKKEDFSIDAPISPPLNVYKQDVNNGILVKWRSNKESDFQHYKLYHGAFEHYSFAHAIDSINDTAILIQGISINDEIAVTSIDTDYFEDDGQFLGNESAYSFARTIPYAGANDSLCSTDTYYAITEATAPMVYTNLTWTSSGSGYFEDTGSLHTKYYPSEEDFENDFVIISLNVNMSTDITFNDSFILKLIKTPRVYAGKDNICYYKSNIEIKDAYISDYDSLKWETSGDGFFENDKIIRPIYHYGVQDSIDGHVTLTLNAYSYCEEKNDDVYYTLSHSYNIEGKVTHLNREIQNAVVIAASINENNVGRLYKTKTDENGRFSFSRFPESEYILYAIPDSTETKGVPTYYANNNSWEDAYKIYLKADIYDIDINLTSRVDNFIDGKGSISGKFEYPDFNFNDSTFYCSAWFEQDTNLIYCDDGLSNIVVSLFDINKNKIINYRITDNEGRFYFDNLPYGSYYIATEIPNYKTSNQYLIKISEKNQHFERLVFFINEDDNIILRSNSTDTNIENELCIFPNPCDKQFEIKGNMEDDLYHIDIFNSKGLKVYHYVGHLSEGNSLNISTENFTNGIYLVRIYNSDNSLYINKLIISH